MKYDVFISYARRDGTPLAQKLALSLREADLQVFWDQDSIPPGRNWEQTLDEALEIATHILVVLTPQSVKSEEVTSEWRPMLSKGKGVVPLLYLPCEIPRRLSMRQYIDFREEVNYQIALTELIEAINTNSPKEIQIELSGEELIQRGISYFEAGQPEFSVRDYLAALSDKSTIVRLRALRYLGAAKRPSTITGILKVLEIETEDAVKVEALQTIMRIVELGNWQDAVPNLVQEIKPFLESGNSDIRRHAIRVLAYGAALEAVPIVIDRLLNDHEGIVRYQAALALGRLQNDEAKAGLIQACSDSFPDARRAAIMALGRYGDKQLISILQHIAKRDKDGAVRSAAAEAIREIETNNR